MQSDILEKSSQDRVDLAEFLAMITDLGPQAVRAAMVGAIAELLPKRPLDAGSYAVFYRAVLCRLQGAR